MRRAFPLISGQITRLLPSCRLFSQHLSALFLTCLCLPLSALSNDSGKQLTTQMVSVSPGDRPATYGEPVTLTSSIGIVGQTSASLPKFKSALSATGPIYIWCFGSSVGVGATLPDPATQAPCPYFASLLQAKLDPLSKANIVVENYSVNGSTWWQFPDAWATAKQSGHTPTLCFFAYGMNDFPVAQYNSGESLGGMNSAMGGAVAAVRDLGADIVVATSPTMSTVNYKDSLYTYFEGNPGAPEVYPVYVAGPVPPESVYPSLENAVVPLVFQDGGTPVQEDFRFLQGNAIQRATAGSALIVDAEAYWFEEMELLTQSLGSQSAAEYQMFAPGNYNHPGLYGHQHSYWPAAQAAVDSIDATFSAPSISGAVEFFVDGTSVGSTTIDGNTLKAELVTKIKPGVHAISAKYAGDTNYLASAGTWQIIAAPTGTAIVLSSSAANPVFGSTVSITAKVAGPDGTVPPTGEVKFLVGPDLLRSVPLNSKGEAVLAISSLPLGANNIQATYDGDANFYGAAPASTLVTVTPASTMLTISGPATAYAGDAVKITAHLSSAFSSPTGTVDFLWNGQSLGSGAVDADGDAVLTTTSLNFGNNQITASYAGTAAYLPSTSEALNIQMLATDFSITAPSTTLSLAAGQTADLPLTITSVGSFNETLWLSCSGLPSFVQCQFSQSSVVPTSGGANVKLTLSVAKTLPAIQISGVLVGGAFLFLIPGVLRRKRLLKGVFVVTLLSVAMTFCNGCGGSRPAMNSNIPAGSYQITVNAKGTSVTHSTNVVLSVTK